MMQKIAHRGPDDSGSWVAPDAPMHLGHQRLSIIDLSSGNQPMRSVCGRYLIVFNGEIYNHPELRQELADEGVVFHSRNSDTETVLNSYIRWGERCLDRFCGMWAFAIYDVAKRELFLSRDRFGEKPLYYAECPDAFVFGSELSAVAVHPSLSARLNRRAVKKLFAYGFIPAPHSMLDGVRKVPAGHSIRVQCDTLAVEETQWWEFTLEPFEGPIGHREQAWCEELRERLETAVKRCLLADVDVGILLSGGVDSSSIAACANRYSAPPLRTFSIAFDEESFDESPYAQTVADALGARHTVGKVSVGSLPDISGEVFSRLDEAMGDPSLVPTAFLCNMVSGHVKVALGGDGGDELFAGYDPFKALAPAALYQKWIPKPVHEGIRKCMEMMPVSHVNMSLDFKIKRALKGLSWPQSIRDAVWLGPLDPGELAELLAEPVDIEDVYEEAIDVWESCAHKDPIEASLQFYTRLYLANNILTKTDRASMMYGLEVRSPFLDRDLVDFVRRLPWQMKYRKGCTKYLLKQAVRPWLPEGIVDRRKKGFGLPIGQWFKDGRIPLSAPGGPEMISASCIGNMKREHLAGKRDFRLPLWNYYVLSNVNYELRKA